MKIILTILLLTTLAFAAQASPVATTTDTVTFSGRSVTRFVSPAQATPYYRMAWATILRGGTTVHVLKYFKYDVSASYDIDNLYCATTYAEMSAEAATLGLTIPSQVTGQP
jgi:hypothetical protein